MHVGDRGQPLIAELSLEHRPRELRLALMEVGAVRRKGDALSGPKRLEQRVERCTQAATSFAIGAMKLRLVSSSSASSCPAGSEYRRRPASAEGSSTSRIPDEACCSSHSLTYRSFVPVRSASSDVVASPSARAR
jgi:hypothetical protein